MDLIARQSGGRNPVARVQAAPSFYAPTNLPPAVVEVFIRYEPELPGAARLIGPFLPGQTVTIPFTPIGDQKVVLSTVSVSGAGVRSVTKLRDAPEFVVEAAGITPGDAAADGVTKGLATFAPADFDDDGAGVISLDYVNGQPAGPVHPGFLQPADFAAFAGKQDPLEYTPLDAAANLADVASVPESRANLGLGGFYFHQPTIASGAAVQVLAVAGNGAGARALVLVIVGGASGLFDCLGVDNRTRLGGFEYLTDEQTIARFSTTAGNEGTFNVFWSGVAYMIENQTGAAYAPAIFVFSDPIH
jgi:hypothetical protein